MHEGGIWAAMAFNMGLMKMMKKDTNLMIFDDNSWAVDF